MKKLILIPLTLAVAGCGAVPWNDQENAGLTDLHVYYDYDAANQVLYPTELRVTDGKEAGTFDLEIEMVDGTKLSFSGTDMKAFEGQDIRGRVETAIAEQLGDVAPGVVDSIVSAILGVSIPDGDDD